MKKRLVTALCSTLAAAAALPAFALTNEVAGFYRARGIYADLSYGKYYQRGATDFKKYESDHLVDQRFRAKWTVGVNDYIKVVYFGEVDFQWGDTSAANGRNEGGALTGDTVNLETKNLYTELKVPNTPVTLTLGLQGFADNWESSWFNADAAGIKVDAKNLGPVDLTAGWFSLYKGNWSAANPPAQTTNNSATQSMGSNGIDLYALQVGFKPNKALKAGVDFYYYRNEEVGQQANINVRGITEDMYYLGANAAYQVAGGMPMTFSGFALYNFGTSKQASSKGENVDVSAYAASAKAELAPAPGATAGVRLMYYSADSNVGDTKQKFVREPFFRTVPEALPYARDNLMLMLADLYQCTYPTLAANGSMGKAISDGAYSGYGLFGAVLSGNFVPPAMKQLYVKAGLGYFTALKKDNGSAREGKTLGTEVAARLGYIIAEKFDVSLNGAYAMLGSFYDKQALSSTGKKTEDPNNPYVLYWMANVNF